MAPTKAPTMAPTKAPTMAPTVSDGVTVDGNYAEWDLSANFLANLYNDGRSDPGYSDYRLVAKSYFRLGCAKNRFCILVKKEPGTKIGQVPGQTWVKDYLAGLPGNKYSENEGVIFFSENGETAGWEGCFTIPLLSSSVRTQVEIQSRWDLSGKNSARYKASTGGAGHYIQLALC